MILMSIVIPVFNESLGISKAVTEIYKVVQGLEICFEIIIVDDGSNDTTWNEVVLLAQGRENIRGIRLSRNFGKERAIRAGLTESQGNCVIVMDGDLQHPPQSIPEMFEIWSSGKAAVIHGVKAFRGQETPFKKLFTYLFYKSMKMLTEYDLKGHSDFKLLDRKVVNALLLMGEQGPFFRGLVMWTGFKQENIFFSVPPRTGGESKWNLSQLFSYGLSNLSSFSVVPLRLVNWLAGCFLLFALVLSFWSFFKYFRGEALEGFTTVIILLLIIGGAILSGLGIIGEYLAKIYEEVKGRPQFLIEKKV